MVARVRVPIPQELLDLSNKLQYTFADVWRVGVVLDTVGTARLGLVSFVKCPPFPAYFVIDYLKNMLLESKVDIFLLKPDSANFVKEFEGEEELLQYLYGWAECIRREVSCR